jgi:hypothetical protein
MRCNTDYFQTFQLTWILVWSSVLYICWSPYKRNMFIRNGSNSFKQDVHYIKYKCSIMYRLHLWKIYLDIISKYFIINSLACALIFKEWLTPLAHFCRTSTINLTTSEEYIYIYIMYWYQEYSSSFFTTTLLTK